MKKSTLLVSILLLLFGITAQHTAFAQLTILSGNYGGDIQTVVYDNNNDLYWIWDIRMFISQDYDEQISSISSLSTNGYFGLNGWTMATHTQFESLINGRDAQYLSTQFNKTSSVPQGNYDYWLGRVEPQQDWSGRPSHWHDGIRNTISSNTWYRGGLGISIDTYQSDYLGAWVVTSGIVPVPEPSSLILLCAGLASTIIIARSRFKIRK
ncbi:PEP-CTERM sorting domain-containing protein [candidate division KSB1 bacterium]|nr:PEP-CTERM sorting domain-containing protein [candidate division KSB1 bacterium]